MVSDSSGTSLSVPVPNIDEVLTLFDVLDLWRGPTRNGPFTTLVASVSLLAKDREYPVTDPVALKSDWYVTQYRSTLTSATSDLSQPIPAFEMPLYTLAELRRLVANEFDNVYLMGISPSQSVTLPPSGTVAAGSSTTSLLSAVFANPLYHPRQMVGRYLRLLGAPAEAQVTGFSVAGGNGVFALSPPLGRTPVGGEPFELYGLKPSAWWGMRVNEAFGDTWVPFWTHVVGVEGQKQYPLPYWVEQEHYVQNYTIRRGDTVQQFEYIPTNRVDIKRMAGGGVMAEIRSGLPPNDVLVVEGVRKIAPVYDDEDIISVDDEHLRLIVVRAAWRAARLLASSVGGSSGDRALWAKRRDELGQEADWLAINLAEFTEQTGVRDESYVGIGGGTSRW